jgi:MFS family permease
MKNRARQVASAAPARDDAAGGGRAVIVLCLIQFVDVLGVTELITALPRILASLSAPQSSASLLLTAYAMCFGGLLMLGARLGDRFGHRRALLAGIAGFAAGSLLCATAAWDLPLIAGRCLQGACAAISVPAALRLLAAATPDRADRRRALSAWSATGAAAGAVGYLLGGGLTQLAGWRAMFWINLPLSLLMGAGILRLTAGQRGARAQSIDLPGALLLTLAVMGLVLAGSRLAQPGFLISGLMILAGAGVVAAALLWVERRAANPIVPVQALRRPGVRTGATAAFLNTATTSPAIALATLELQRAQRLDPAAAGLRLMPFSLCVIVGATLAGRALRRLSGGVVIALGLSCIGAGDGLLAALDHTPVSTGVAIVGIGIGLSSVAATGLGTSVGARMQAAAAGTINTAAQLGTALGLAGVLLAVATAAGSGLPLQGPRLGWAVAAGLALAGAALTATRNRVLRA